MQSQNQSQNKNQNCSSQNCLKDTLPNKLADKFADSLIEPRYNWTREEIMQIYTLPFPELMYQAQTVHRKHFPKYEIQRSTLLSIKTGGCPEDCAYCPQSAHHDTGVERHKILAKEIVLAQARKAKSEGSTRFCMGAAWRQVKDGEEFDQVIDLVSGVAELGLEVCCTLGMVTLPQAKRLKDAGCHAYNHNLDSSPEFYEKIISTRTYQERLETLKNVRQAGITVCCGGILGMGEEIEDRIGLVYELATQNPHPESVPINMLVKVKGTPLFDDPGVQARAVEPLDFIKTIAIARVTMPKAYVRLSAGRMEMSEEMQTLCFLAGANSIFAGEKLLTTPNPSWNEDAKLVEKLGMSFVSA